MGWGNQVKSSLFIKHISYSKCRLKGGTEYNKVTNADIKKNNVEHILIIFSLMTIVSF